MLPTPPQLLQMLCVRCWELEAAEHLAWDPAQSKDSKRLVPHPPPHLTAKTDKANQLPSTVIRARIAKRLTKKGPSGSGTGLTCAGTQWMKSFRSQRGGRLLQAKETG